MKNLKWSPMSLGALLLAVTIHSQQNETKVPQSVSKLSSGLSVSASESLSGQGSVPTRVAQEEADKPSHPSTKRNYSKMPDDEVRELIQKLLHDRQIPQPYLATPGNVEAAANKAICAWNSNQ